MQKGFNQDITTSVVVNGYVIDAFSFNQHDPNNPNTARVDVVYSLATISHNGTATVSELPSHRGLGLTLYNIGDDKRLDRWLGGNGTPNDPIRFDYHDIARLVEADIVARFGIMVK